MSSMFEQPLYEFQPVAAAPSEQGGLFRNYEIKSWVFTPRLMSIVAISAVVNIVAFLVVAQTSLLTMKGCDSPLVGGVCQVLDTVYVGALLFGTDREYVDAAYEKTELGPDDEITYIDVSKVTPPLTYPVGYFEIANPEQFVPYEEDVIDPGKDFTHGIPGIPNGMPITPPSSGENLFDTQPVVPKSNPNVVEGELPKSNNGSGGGIYFPPIQKKWPKPYKKSPPLAGGPEETPPGNGQTVATDKSPAATPAPSVEVAPTPDGDVREDQFGVFINKRPLTDGALATLQSIDSKQIKLDTNFKVGITGTLGLGKDGKTVVLKNPKTIPPEKGVQYDPNMEKFVEQWILLLGDSGWLGYFEILDKQQKIKDKRVKIMFEQNDAELLSTINVELPNENVAASFASALNIILVGSVASTDGDEQLFLKGAQTTSNGNSLVLNVKYPKPIVQEMIGRYLKAKAQPKPTDGNAGTKPADNPGKN